VLELQYHTQRNYGAGNVAVEGSVIEAFTDMAPSVALAALGRQMLLDELAHVGESSQCRDGRFSTAGAGGAISSDGATRGSSRTQYRSEIGRRISYPSERDPIHRGLRSGLPPAHIPSWCRPRGWVGGVIGDMQPYDIWRSGGRNGLNAAGRGVPSLAQGGRSLELSTRHGSLHSQSTHS
jgi:hypothetical protein